MILNINDVKILEFVDRFYNVKHKHSSKLTLIFDVRRDRKNSVRRYRRRSFTGNNHKSGHFIEVETRHRNQVWRVRLGTDERSSGTVLRGQTYDENGYGNRHVLYRAKFTRCRGTIYGFFGKKIVEKKKRLKRTRRRLTCEPWELSASWHTNVTKSDSVSCPFSGYLAGLCCSGPDVAEP